MIPPPWKVGRTQFKPCFENYSPDQQDSYPTFGDIFMSYLVISIVEQLTASGETSQVGSGFREELRASSSPWRLLRYERFRCELSVYQIHNNKDRRY